MGSSLFGGGTGTTNSNTNSNQSQNSSTTSGANSNQASTQNGTTAPAGFQMPYINSGLQNAASLYANQSGGQLTPLAYSSMSQQTRDAINNLNGAATGSSVPSTLLNRGNIDASQMDGAIRDLGAGFDTTSGASGAAAMGGSLLGAGAGGASSILARAMSGDPTGGNIADAMRYANNPYTSGMITAANTPIERQLNEVALPGNNRAAIGSGNTDSSRAGMTEAILRRGAGEDEANNASTILGNQFNTGLNLAENARQANQGAALNASGQLGSLGNSEGSLADAITRIGSTQAGIGSQLSGIGQVGDNELTSGNNTQLSNLGVPIQTGQMTQNDANAGNQVSYNNGVNSQQMPWQTLSNYWNIAGRPLGSTTTGTSTATGSQTGTSDTSGTSTGTNATTGTQTQPGPGMLGGLLGLGTGIGSFFAPTGALGLGPSLASSIGKFFGR